MSARTMSRVTEGTDSSSPSARAQFYCLASDLEAVVARWPDPRIVRAVEIFGGAHVPRAGQRGQARSRLWQLRTDETPLALIDLGALTASDGMRATTSRVPRPDVFRSQRSLALVTDARLVVRGPGAEHIVRGAVRDYPWYADTRGLMHSARALVTTLGAVKPHVASFLEKFLHTVLNSLDELGMLRIRALATPGTLRDRAYDLRLARIMKLPSVPRFARHFESLRVTFPELRDERVLAGFTYGTVAGPYGLVLTDRRLHSKVLGQPPRTMPREHARALRQSDIDVHRLIANQTEVHDAPEYWRLRDVQGFTQLAREWASGALE
ncbi:hypothetical protein [Microbacterium halophytorum]|uniref:hypothetical protein n=1 Tax=Microbacterium halophytorum TaxID=2067568 RepID=UPI001319BC1F|nr:hypothetical protein [Microbacterium halophytorum]